MQELWVGWWFLVVYGDVDYVCFVGGQQGVEVVCIGVVMLDCDVLVGYFVCCEVFFYFGGCF